MRDLQRRWMGVLVGSVMTLSGCTYAAIQKLSLEEQSEFHTYQKVMTPSQERTYLAKATAVERTTYLSEIGLAQRFHALAPVDRDAVLGGVPRVGMSAEALLFLWGEPYYTAGDARRYAHWYYLGSSFDLAAYGNRYAQSGNRVDVYLVAGQIVGWVDYAPSDESPGRRIR
jgi:hypothetical protein